MLNVVSGIVIFLIVISFEISLEPASKPSEPMHEPSEPMHEPMHEPVRLLTEAEIYRAHRVFAAVLAAKFAIRHNLPGGYACASEEMRKYI